MPENCNRLAVRRKAPEVAAKESRRNHDNCLKKPLRLQKHAQGLTHRGLKALEHERDKVSPEPQDETAQTLPGHQGPIAFAKTGGGLKSGMVQNEIASTRRLV